MICPRCGKEEQTWADRRFGCACSGRRRRLPFVRSSGGPVADEGYQSTLARFPGDPQAYTTGRDSFRRLVDQRKREGWQVRDPDTLTTPRPASRRNLAAEAAQEAREILSH